MLTRLNQRIADRDRQKGFTLIELLVVIIIIGILAAIAIPAFLNQRTKAYDAAAKSDLKNASTAMETFYTDSFKYPASDANLKSGGFTGSDGVSYRVYASASGPSAGYVIYAKHEQSDKAWVVSSYNGGAPAPAGTALPTGNAPGTGLGVPTGAGAPTFTAFNKPTA